MALIIQDLGDNLSVDHKILCRRSVFQQSLHDREILLNGVEWLHQMLEENRGKRFYFVRELGEAMLTQAKATQPV